MIESTDYDYWYTGQTNCSGHADVDYPCLDTSVPALANLPLLNPDIHHVPLPPELIEEFHSIFVSTLTGLHIVEVAFRK